MREAFHALLVAMYDRRVRRLRVQAHAPPEDGDEPGETTPPDTLDGPRCACPRECHDPAPSLSDPYPWDALERAALDLATAADAAHDEEQLEPEPAELEDEPATSPDEVDPWLLIF